MKYILYFLIALYAIFWVQLTSSPLVIPKLAFISFGVLIALAAWLIESIIKGKLEFSIGKFDIAVLLISISFLLSSFFSTPNKMEAFLLPGVTTFVVAGAFLYFLVNQLKKEGKNIALISLISSGLLLSIYMLFREINLYPGVFGANPMGGAVPTSIYLAALIPLCIGGIIKNKELVKRIFFSVAVTIIVLGLGINIKNMLPGKAETPRLAPFQASWEVAVDALKTSPILGIGPANYLTAFNRFRPISYNQTDLWPLRFATASSFYLTVLTELGFLGLFALSLLFISVYRLVRKGINFESGALLGLLFIFLLLPVSPALMLILFILLALNSGSEDNTKDIMNAPSKLPILLPALPVFIGIAVFSFFAFRALLAEEKYRTALESIPKNEAQKVFDSMREAIRLNPRVDRYRASMAQINLVLASSIARKENITDADRTNISQLVQASIAEGKANVALNPGRSGSWELLARIYRSIMPFAQGADNFAIQTFTQAVALDPINPNLRIALGGTYFALGRIDESIEAFKLAVVAKPDHANAHYNLAIAYREKKDLAKATEEMNTVLSLVGKDSADYQTALKELQNIASLEQPRPVEESNVKPPIELPVEAIPPTPAATPTTQEQ